MFRVEGLSKFYPGVTALKDLSFRIGEGEAVAVVGPSGSGKTTLLKLLAAQLLPDRGAVWIGGGPSSRLRPGRELARLVGLLPQQLDLVGALPVVHNVLAGRLGEWGFLRSLLSLVAPQELPRARAVLERVGLGDRLFDRTACLSGGEQQRVALARLLVQAPRAILADEPVSSLDPARAEDLVAMLTRLARAEGITVVASLHAVSLALRHFPRVIGLRAGQLLFDCPAAEVSPGQLETLFQLPAPV